VLWFGNISSKNPSGIQGESPTQTAQEFEVLLRKQLEGKLSALTQLFVLNLSRTPKL
jgi:hypothetical protein